jgi:hypothetical protein
MKAEVLAPDHGNNKRDFHFTAEVKRVHIYPEGFPETNTNWLAIVEKDGEIKVIWHGKFVGDNKVVYVLDDETKHLLPNKPKT